MTQISAQDSRRAEYHDAKQLVTNSQTIGLCGKVFWQFLLYRSNHRSSDWQLYYKRTRDAGLLWIHHQHSSPCWRFTDSLYYTPHWQLSCIVKASQVLLDCWNCCKSRFRVSLENDLLCIDAARDVNWSIARAIEICLELMYFKLNSCMLGWGCASPHISLPLSPWTFHLISACRCG